MNNSFIDCMKKRRTQYSIGKSVNLSNERIENLIKEAVKNAPSAFNSQSSRVVILFDKESIKFWNMTKDILQKIVPKDSFATTEKKLASFAAGIGTILFYEDQDVIKEFQKQYPLYADNFPVWSEHGSGIAQFAVWSTLANENIGASLQHYNPLVDETAEKNWNISKSWKLRAQMPFGSNEKAFPDKTFIDDSIRFKSFT